MGRLFWKIFGWFWLAMVLVALGVGFGVAPFSEQDDRPRKRDILQLMVARHQARVAANLRSKGLEEAQAIARSIEKRAPIKLQIVEISGDAAKPRKPLPEPAEPASQFRSHRVTLKDGRRYEIQVSPKPGMALLKFLSHTLRIPLPMLASISTVAN